MDQFRADWVSFNGSVQSKSTRLEELNLINFYGPGKVFKDRVSFIWIGSVLYVLHDRPSV